MTRIKRTNLEPLISFDQNGKIRDKLYFKEGVNKNGYSILIKHNETGPALIEYDHNGNVAIEFYFINGILHRDNGPAIIQYDENGNKLLEEYYRNEEIHRDDGPAIIRYDTNEYLYFFNGIEVTNIVKNNPEILTDYSLRKILL